MDIVNSAEAPDSQITAGPADAAGDRTKSCPLCCTLNHPLSRECFNCGWRGALCGSRASSGCGPVSGQTTFLIKAQCLRSGWRTLMNWLFFTGSRRCADLRK